MMEGSRLLFACLLVIRCGWICGQTPGQEIDLEFECLRSSDPTIVQQLRLETVKQEILLRLNLDTEPVNPDPESLKMEEKRIIDEYNAVKKASEIHSQKKKPCIDLQPDSSVLIVLFPTDVQASGLPTQSGLSQEALSDTYRLTFELDLQNIGEISSAELRLFKVAREGADQGSRHVVYDRVEVLLRLTNVEHYWDADLLLPITAIYVDPDTDGYVIIDVKSVIDKWIKETHSLKGEITVELWIRSPEALAPNIVFNPRVQFLADNSTTQLIIRAESSEPPESSGNETTVSNLNSRQKRQSNVRTQYCIDNPDQPQCCLRILEIDFERDFNWTWILYPKSIPFNYCSGVCPIGWAIIGEHSKFLSLLAARSERLNNPVAAASPCCVPNSFLSEVIAIKAIPDEPAHIEFLDNIVVTSCVCR